MKHAFSLVELSIVLVILGLLTGGILTGQSLIRAAELRAVTTEYQSYKTAAMTFRDKYFALPGDMRNATDFWGSAGGSGTIGDGCETATGTGTQTCNGNANGAIGAWSPAAGNYGESFTFWQHLANAGMLEGSYTGISGAGGASHSIGGVNSPRSKLSNAGWGIAYVQNYAGDVEAFALDYGNFFSLGTFATNGAPDDPVLTPEEAWNIDTKIDDGKPGYGSVIGRFWNNACSAADNGTHANNNLEASYRLTDTSAQCALHFVRSF